MIDSLFWILFRAVPVLGLFFCSIVVHELGHYLAARCVGYSVQRFTIGSGPVLLSRNVSHTLFELRSSLDSGSILRDCGDEIPWKDAFICLSGPFAEILFGILIVGVSALNRWDIFYGTSVVGFGAYCFVQFGPYSDVKRVFEALLDEDVFLRSSVRLLFRISYGALIFTLFVIEVVYDIFVLRPH